MSRTIKEVQHNLFSLLTKRASSIELEEYPKVRIYLTGDEFDSLSKDISLLAIVNLGKEHTASIYNYKGFPYLVVSAEYENLEIDYLSPVEDIKEIGILFITDNKFSPKSTVTELDLLENIFIDTENDNDIEWSTVANYFPKYSIFKIEDSIPQDSIEAQIYLKKLCIALQCKTKALCMLPFDDKTIDAFLDIANTYDNNIPFDNILRSMMSNDWKFCFIELYRCQERLLLLAWVDEFKKTMNSSLTLAELHKNMKSRYHTEHHEDQNIISLYNLLSSDMLDLLSVGDTHCEKAKYIYDLRNKIVHYQKSNTYIEGINDSDWNNIIKFILKSIPHLYLALRNHINELPEL